MPTPKVSADTYLADSEPHVKSDLLTREEASAYLRVPLGTLDNWRSNRIVRLPFYKLGGRVFYRLPELDDFLQRCRVS